LKDSKYITKQKTKTNQGKTRQFKAIQGNTRQIKANQGNTRQIKANQGKSRQIKANQGNSRQFKRGDILPVIMFIFKISHQFLCRSQDIRTNVSDFITLLFFYKV
jgi:hypothetical protein